MASTKCQRVRGARIVGKPTPTGVRAERRISCRNKLACNGINSVPASTRRLHRWQANSHRGPRSTLLFCGSRLACDGIGAVSVGTQRPHRWQANSHRGPRSTLLFCGMQACLRWYRRSVSGYAAPASLASQLPQGAAQYTAFLWNAGLPAMVSAQCQWVRSACIVDKSTPTGGRAVHCFSVGAGLPAMVSARCQWVRSACIIGKPTPTGGRAVHCFSVGAGLPAMVSARCQWVRSACIIGKPTHTEINARMF